MKLHCRGGGIPDEGSDGQIQILVEIISPRRPTGLAVGGTVVLSGVLTAALVITLGCGNTAKTVPGPAALSSSPTPVCGNASCCRGRPAHPPVR